MTENIVGQENVMLCVSETSRIKNDGSCFDNLVYIVTPFLDLLLHLHYPTKISKKELQCQVLQNLYVLKS